MYSGAELLLRFCFQLALLLRGCKLVDYYSGGGAGEVDVGGRADFTGT